MFATIQHPSTVLQEMKPSRYVHECHDRQQHESFYMCRCHVTHNFFVRCLGTHLSYNGDDIEFMKRYADLLPESSSLDLALADVRSQQQKRLQAPQDADERMARIAQSYQVLHQSIYTIDHRLFISPSLHTIVSGLRSLGDCSADRIQDCIEGLQSAGHLRSIGKGLWSFPVFTDSFCDLLEDELQHFLASGLPHTAPNTMNRYGVILAELGLCPGLLTPFVNEYVDIIASYLLPCHTRGLDSYRAFTVLYDAVEDGDRELALHYDNAEVTLNVNIGGTFEGGQVAFLGLATERTSEGQAHEIVLQRGYGVLHPGLELHRALPITSGRRHNLIFWCRSSGIRNERCPMCFERPQVISTNSMSHEGFTVPPCEIYTKTLWDSTCDDDLYS